MNRDLTSYNNEPNNKTFEGQNINNLINNNNLFDDNTQNYSNINNYKFNNIQPNNNYSFINQKNILSNNNQIEEYSQNNIFNNFKNNNIYNQYNDTEPNIEYENNEFYNVVSIMQSWLISISEFLSIKINDELIKKLDKNSKSEKIDNISLYYITNIEDNEKNDKMKLINDLFKLKVGNFEVIKFPTISYDEIEKRIKILNYEMTLEDNKLIEIIKNYNFSSFDGIKFDYDGNIFYSQNKMSLYSPHILKENNDITSIFLNEEQKKLSIYDFQYIYSHLNSHIFKDLLQKRIIQLNNKELNEKIYGFYKDYMYTIMDKEIVEKKLNDTNIFKLKQELLCNQSENY